MATLTPTIEQKNVLDSLSAYFQAKYGPDGYHSIFSLFLSAVAGSGKTSTIKMICRLLAEVEAEYGVQLEACSLSFNKIIAVQGNAALKVEGLREICKTTNSLGNGLLKEAANQGQCHEPKRLNNKKYRGLADRYITKNRKNIPNVPYGSKVRISDMDLAGKISKLVSAARLTFCDATSQQELAAIVFHYPDTKIDVHSPYWSFIWKAVQPIISDGIALYNATGELDFDDQIFLPLALNIAVPMYDFIAIDEAQDLNKVRTELIMRSIKPNGALFFVGDRRQAIQGFAYADTASVDNIIAATNAVEMPLTCCWRCDKNIIRMAQAINPAIEARPNAEAGIVEMVDKDFVGMLRSGYYEPVTEYDERDAYVNETVDADMVLCRVTADLVSACLSAIRQGIRAIVRGKDIGANIIKKLDQILGDYPEAFNLEKLSACARKHYTEYALALAFDDNAEEELAKLLDQIDTIDALLSGYWLSKPEEPTMNEFKAFIESKFADDEDMSAEGPRPVVFSTVHKAKGLETDRVFILRPELLPHPMALKSGKAWQEEQEENIAYVAVTRPKHELYFVGGMPAYFEEVYAELLDEQAGPVVIEETIIEELTEEDTAAAVVEAEKIVATPKQPAKPGRKMLADADKPAKLEAFLDPDLKQAFSAFVEMVQSLDEESLKDILPNQETTINPSGKISLKKVSGADIVQAALMSFAPFKAYFETSEQYSGYIDRKDRKQSAREDYSRKKGKKVAQPEEIKEVEQDIYDLPGNEDLDPEVVEDQLVSYGSSSLFPDLPEQEEEASPRKVERIFYFCPRCKKHWYADYYVSKDNQRYREQDGLIIYAVNDFVLCPFGCGNERKWFRKTIQKRTYSSKRKCDSRCYNARPGSSCTCECGGMNHGTGGDNQVKLIGQALLLAQNEAGE